jgi:hypothetical protein
MLLMVECSEDLLTLGCSDIEVEVEAEVEGEEEEEDFEDFIGNGKQYELKRSLDYVIRK